MNRNRLSLTFSRYVFWHLMTRVLTYLFLLMLLISIIDIADCSAVSVTRGSAFNRADHAGVKTLDNSFSVALFGAVRGDAQFPFAAQPE